MDCFGAAWTFLRGRDQRECYVNTITAIDQLGQFVVETSNVRKAAYLAERRRENLPKSPRARRGYFFRLCEGEFQRSCGRSDISLICRKLCDLLIPRNAARLPILEPAVRIILFETKIRPLFCRLVAVGKSCGVERARSTRRCIAIKRSIGSTTNRSRRRFAEVCATRADGCADTGHRNVQFGKNKLRRGLPASFYTNAIHVMKAPRHW